MYPGRQFNARHFDRGQCNGLNQVAIESGLASQRFKISIFQSGQPSGSLRGPTTTQAGIFSAGNRAFSNYGSGRREEIFAPKSRLRWSFWPRFAGPMVSSSSSPVSTADSL